MPLARIRTDARELALDLAEELYELGYTVETISPFEYREQAADLEIQLQPCEPDELISVVARAGDEYQKIYLAEGVIDRLPLYVEEPPPTPHPVRVEPVPVESAPAKPQPIPIETASQPIPLEPVPVVPQPIAFVEIAVPPETPLVAAENTSPTQPELVPESADPVVQEVPVLAATTGDPYAQQASARTRRVAELVAGAGAALGRVGLFVSDQIDDCRDRLSSLRTELSHRMQERAARVQQERQRKAEIAAAEAVRREAESQRLREEAAALARAKQEAEALARSKQETTVPEPEPAVVQPKVVQPEPAKPFAPVPERVQVARRRPSPFQRAFNQPFRNPSGLALKLGTAVGLLGMVVVIGYANRRPATPVGIGELTRSTTVKQSAPFGAAEVKASAQTSLAPIPTSTATPALEKRAPEVKPPAKTQKAAAEDFDGEPEVVVRHYAAQPKPAPKPLKSDGIKRFSDLD